MRNRTYQQSEDIEYTAWRRTLAWIGLTTIIAVPVAVFACNYYVAVTLGI